MIDSVRLPRRARELLTDPGGEQLVSAISVWEIAIKHARRGAALMPLSGRATLEWLREVRLPLLDVTGQHAAAVDCLPPIHGDPFDRMLIAQALTEPLRLLTADATLARYSDTVILV